MPFRALYTLITPKDTSIANSWTRPEAMPLLLSQQVSVPKKPLNIEAGQSSEISGSIARLSSEEVGVHRGPESTKVMIMHR